MTKFKLGDYVITPDKNHWQPEVRNKIAVIITISPDIMLDRNMSSMLDMEVRILETNRQVKYHEKDLTKYTGPTELFTLLYE